MRIALVGTGVEPVPPTGYGGVERTLAELAAALRRLGHSVEVLQAFGRGRATDEYRLAWRLPAMLRRTDADVVHASTPVVANRLGGRHSPFVYTTHSRHWFERRRWTEHWGYYLERRAVRRSRVTIALTDRLADRIRTAVRANRTPPIVTIPIGVDLEQFRPTPGPRTGRVALGVGVLRREKRWEIAARALRGTGIEFRLIGPQPDRSYAAEVARAGDRVSLLGEVPEDALREEYARADMLLHPSRVELLPGVVLQGLASGLPVIGAAPVSGLVEDRVTGWSAPEGLDEEALVRFFRAHALELSGDEALRARLSGAARSVAEERFGWSSIALAHVRLYESVVAAR